MVASPWTKSGVFEASGATAREFRRPVATARVPPAADRGVHADGRGGLEWAATDAGTQVSVAANFKAAVGVRVAAGDLGITVEMPGGPVRGARFRQAARY